MSASAKSSASSRARDVPCDSRHNDLVTQYRLVLRGTPMFSPLPARCDPNRTIQKGRNRSASLPLVPAVADRAELLGRLQPCIVAQWNTVETVTGSLGCA